MRILKRAPAPLRVVVYGRPGVGKTTWATRWPSPIVTGAEDGAGHVDADRLPICVRLEDLESQLHELTTEDHGYRTVVLDTLDSIQGLVHAAAYERQQPRKGSSFATIPYGAGPALACEVWACLLARIDLLTRIRGVNVVCCAHSTRRMTHDPSTEEQYERVTLALAEKTSLLIFGWSDAVLYASTDDVVRGKRQVAVGERILESQPGPGFEAKSRLPRLPSKISMAFEEFSSHVDLVDGPTDPRVKELESLTDPSKFKALRTWLAQGRSDSEIESALAQKRKTS